MNLKKCVMDVNVSQPAPSFAEKAAPYAGFGQGVLGFIGGLINRRAQRKQYERTLEYNKPVNQMARLKEAGLNPNLVYGKGVQGLGSAPPPNLPNVEAPNLGRGLQDYQNVTEKGLQIDLLRTQRNIADQQFWEQQWKANHMRNVSLISGFQMENYQKYKNQIGELNKYSLSAAKQDLIRQQHQNDILAKESKYWYGKQAVSAAGGLMGVAKGGKALFEGGKKSLPVQRKVVDVNYNY